MGVPGGHLALIGLEEDGGAAEVRVVGSGQDDA
jgi:hypothetical protein